MQENAVHFSVANFSKSKKNSITIMITYYINMRLKKSITNNSKTLIFKNNILNFLWKTWQSRLTPQKALIKHHKLSQLNQLKQQQVVRIRFLAKFWSRALYLERREIFRILLNEYFRYFERILFLFSYFRCQTSSDLDMIPNFYWI